MLNKRTVSFIVTLIILICSTSGTFAIEKNKEDFEWEKRRAYIEKNIIELGSISGEAVNEWLEDNGVVKVDSIIAQDDIGIQSAPGDIDLNRIEGYYDTAAKKYLVKGWWKWKSIGVVDGVAGALDGVSLAMAKTNDWSPATGYVLASNPAGIAVYDQGGTHYPNAGNSSKIDKSGIVYTFQDKWTVGRYVGYQGQVWFWMNQKPTQLPLYIKMDFIHTWSSANLSSFGLEWKSGSPPNINLQFNVVPSNVKVENQITLYSWPNF